MFNQVGLNIGVVTEAVVKGAFLLIWMQENPDEVEKISDRVKDALALPPKA